MVNSHPKQHSRIHSHIQIPNTILKHFRDETDKEKKVWYLDIKTQTINKKPSGRLGTSKGYYSIDGENYWNATIEDPIGKLNKQVLSFCAGDIKKITFHPQDMDIVKLYIKSAMVRSNNTFESMKKAIPNNERYTDQELHDAMSVIGMKLFDTILKNLKFDNMVATVLINRTERSFVVPRNCFYCVERDAYPNYVMPISPKAALLLLPNEQLQITTGTYGLIDTPEQISRLNRHALKYECLLNKDFVASDSCVELEYLQETLKNPPW